jgi:hypothetical protein
VNDFSGMKIHKEVFIRLGCPTHWHTLRTTHYAYTLDYLMWLYEKAKEDFPDLRLSDVQVAHYAGERYARTYGIEFLRSGLPHPDYTPISRREKTY